MPTSPTQLVDQYDLFVTWKNRTNETITIANQARSDIGNIDGVGGLSNVLTTNNKTTLVAAINEHDAEIGNLPSLITSTKSTLVGAINEVQSDCGEPVNLTTSTKTSAVAAINEHDAEIGDLLSLTTTDKATIVGAINEVQSDCGEPVNLTTINKLTLVAAINEHDAEIGDLLSLTTTDKATLVAAINEVQSETDINTNNISTLFANQGIIENLTTTNKTSTVAAINEIQSEADLLSTEVGNLTSLTTTIKTDVVSAINEVHQEANISRVLSSVQAPATGFSITVADDIHTLILSHVATIATGTITFPANPLNDDRLTISSANAVTSLTLSGNGKTILGGITTISANGFATWQYISAATTWFRIG